jgi:hypothetical protein
VGTSYVRDEQALLNFKRGLKLRACSHCGRVGFLIGHGCLFGYCDASSQRVVRGHRMFCSDRGRRMGCGCTSSVLFGFLMARFMVSHSVLFAFVGKVVGGKTRHGAWKAMARNAMSLQSAYRLWKRLVASQHHIRARLCAVAPPPPSQSISSVAHLLEHTKLLWPSMANGFEEFQLHFQLALFGT